MRVSCELEDVGENVDETGEGVRLSEGESKGSSGDELEGDKGGVGGEAGIRKVDVESDGDED